MLKVKKGGNGHQHPKMDEVQKIITKESTKRLNADLPQSFYNQVKIYALENDLTVTELVKRALNNEMSK